MSSPGVLYIRPVPRGVKDMFRAACVKRGKSMKEVIVEFMKEYIQNDNKAIITPRRRKR